MSGSSSVTWTSRVLLAGSLVSAVCFAFGFALSSLGEAGAGAGVSTAAGVAILLTPVVGLVTTIIEVRRAQPQTALVALGVVAVLGVAVGVAALAR